jgi:hypothetical protein
MRGLPLAEARAAEAADQPQGVPHWPWHCPRYETEHGAASGTLGVLVPAR